MSVVGLLQKMMAPLTGQSSTKAAGGDEALSGGNAFDALLSQQLTGASMAAASFEPLPNDEAISETFSETMMSDASIEEVTPEESFTLSVSQEPLSFLVPLPAGSLDTQATVFDGSSVLSYQTVTDETSANPMEESTPLPLVLLATTPLLPHGMGTSYVTRSTKMMGERTREQDFSVNSIETSLEETTMPENDAPQSVSVNSTPEMMASSGQPSSSDSLSTEFMENVKERNVKDKIDKDENTVADAMPSMGVSSDNTLQSAVLVTSNPANISSNEANTMAAIAAQQGVANAMPMIQSAESVKPNRTQEESQGALAVSSLPSASTETASKLLLPPAPIETKPAVVEHEPPQPFVIPMVGDPMNPPVLIDASDKEGGKESLMRQGSVGAPTSEQTMALAESVSLEASPPRSDAVGVRRLLDSRGTFEMTNVMGSSSRDKHWGGESMTVQNHGQTSNSPSLVVGKPLTVTDITGGIAAVNVSMAGASGAAFSEARGDQPTDDIGINTMGAMSSSQGVLGGFSPLSDVAKNVVSQVVDGTVQAHLDSPTPARPTQVSLILNPEHLGSVRVQLTANPPGGPDAGAIQARFIVSTPEAQTLLTQQLESLSHRLESQNVKLDRIHIILAPDGVSASQSSSSSTGSGLFQSGDQSAQSGSQGNNPGSQQGPSYQEQADRQQWFQQLAGGFQGQGHPNHSGNPHSLYASPPKGLSPSGIPLIEGGQRAQSPSSGGVDHRIASGTTNISLLI
ncbi:MAG: flagellar hook-length control protein FliK [Vampirovibrionales bacterium]|nr:flagellar hook-length control protein FliK [Vampirovibrionales bacterium]